MWAGRDEARRVRVRVAGDEAGPVPACAAALEALVGAFDEVIASIDRFVVQRGPAGSIRFRSRPDESFPVSICGFGVGLTLLDMIAVTDPANPTCARLTVETGEPDGYVVYDVTLERGVPVHIEAVFT